MERDKTNKDKDKKNPLQNSKNTIQPSTAKVQLSTLHDCHRLLTKWRADRYTKEQRTLSIQKEELSIESESGRNRGSCWV